MHRHAGSNRVERLERHRGGLALLTGPCAGRHSTCLASDNLPSCKQHKANKYLAAGVDTPAKGSMHVALTQKLLERTVGTNTQIQFHSA